MFPIIVGMIIVLALLLFSFYFMPQIEKLIEENQKQLETNTQYEEEKDQGVSRVYLNVDGSSKPKEILHELFENLNPDFLNEMQRYKIIYNSFVLDLDKGYNIYDSEIIDGIKEGINSFSSPTYKIGTDNSVYCDVIYRNLNYDNCFYDSEPSNSCLIYVNGGSNNQFNDKLKISVIWYKKGSGVIKTLISLCGR